MLYTEVFTLKIIEELMHFLNENKESAKEELRDISDKNCYSAGYERGIIAVISEIEYFIRKREYSEVYCHKIIRLNLSTRLYNILKKNNLIFIGDLVVREGADLRKSGLGRKLFDELQNALREYEIVYKLPINSLELGQILSPAVINRLNRLRYV